MQRFLLSVLAFLLFILCAQAEEKISVLELQGHTSGVNFAAFSPDGKKIVTASKDNTARIWDAESGKELKKLEGHTDEVNSASFSPDGKKIVTASWDRTARIWDAESGKELKKFSGVDNPALHVFSIPLMAYSGWEEPKSIRFASFSPDGRDILVALNITARIWDAESGEERQRFDGHLPDRIGKYGRMKSHGITSALYAPDGKKIVTTGGNTVKTRCWDVQSGRKLLDRLDVSSPAMPCFSPDGQIIVGPDAIGKSIYFWDTDSGKYLKMFSNSRSSIYGNDPIEDWPNWSSRTVTFSLDGKQLVITYDSSTVHAPFRLSDKGELRWPPRIVDADSGKELHRLEGHTNEVMYAEFSPDGKKVVTASADNTARIWILE